jgi:hypothetical protein
VRQLILVFAVMGVAVMLASGAALGITGGKVDGTGGVIHPYVGALVDRSGAYCSGTLIPSKLDDQGKPEPGYPPVFLTAAHCDPFDLNNDPDDGNTAYVTFAPKYDAERRQFPNGRGEEYKGTFYADEDTFNDIAVVTFDEQIPSITPAQLPSVHQFDSVTKSQRFTAVGYGATSGSSNDYGERRYAVSTFKSVNQTYLRLSQHNGSGGTCYGDSGGPNFLGEYPYDYDKNPATENVPIIAGTTITGDTWCKATNVTLRLDTKSARDFLGKYVTLP